MTKILDIAEPQVEPARSGLDIQRLGEVIDTISLAAANEGQRSHCSVDRLGCVYEYSLACFASAEGKNGGQSYTPSCFMRCLVEMLSPYNDPACRFAQSKTFVESHGDISVNSLDRWVRQNRPFGIAKRACRVRRRRQPKQSNASTGRLAVMNLALRGIEANFGSEHADTFPRDLHPHFRADYVLANPPFNDSDCFRFLEKNRETAAVMHPQLISSFN